MAFECHGHALRWTSGRPTPALGYDLPARLDPRVQRMDIPAYLVTVGTFYWNSLGGCTERGGWLVGRQTTMFPRKFSRRRQEVRVWHLTALTFEHVSLRGSPDPSNV